MPHDILKFSCGLLTRVPKYMMRYSLALEQEGLISVSESQIPTGICARVEKWLIIYFVGERIPEHASKHTLQFSRGLLTRVSKYIMSHFSAVLQECSFALKTLITLL